MVSKNLRLLLSDWGPKKIIYSNYIFILYVHYNFVACFGHDVTKMRSAVTILSGSNENEPPSDCIQRYLVKTDAYMGDSQLKITGGNLRNVIVLDRSRRIKFLYEKRFGVCVNVVTLVS